MKDTSPNPQQTSLIFKYFNEIGIISQLSAAMFERNLPHGLNSSQFSVLNWFTRVDTQATPGRLANAFQVTPGAMTNTLKKLQGKGFVDIKPDSQSGRSKLVTLTPQGAAAREAAIATAVPAFQDFAATFDVESLSMQLKDLEKVRAYLDESRYK